VLKAIEIITAAVNRYNLLCGGAYAGKAVDRAQVGGRLEVGVEGRVGGREMPYVTDHISQRHLHFQT